MVNVVFSGDNVTVLGGATQLEVDLNVGAEGTRGGLFFVGDANPNTLNPLQDFIVPPLVFDIFINVNPASENYLQAYQYRNQDGQNTWVPVFKILQEGYKANKVAEFVNGEADIEISVAELGFSNLPFDNPNNSFSYFNVQATINNIDLDDLSEPSKPASISVEVGDAFTGNEGSFDPGEFPTFLPIKLRALEFDGGTWSPIDNKKLIVYLSISFANPNEIFQNVEFIEEES